MKKVILFIFFFLAIKAMEEKAIEEAKTFESGIIEKNWALNPLKNLSQEKKVEIINEFLNIKSEILNSIKSQTNRERHKLEEKQNALESLESFLYAKKLSFIHPHIFARQRIGDGDEFFEALSEWLDLLLIKRGSTQKLELIAFIYINLKRTYNKIRKIEKQKKEKGNSKWNYKRYRSITQKRYKKRISKLFLQKAIEIISRSLLVNKLAIDKLKENNNPDLISTEARSALQRLGLFTEYKISNFERSLTSLNKNTTEIIKKALYWRFKAKKINPKINDAKLLKIMQYEPSKDPKNPYSTIKRIRELSMIPEDYKMPSPSTLQKEKRKVINENSSLIKRLNQRKEQQKKAYKELLATIKQAIADENYNLANVALKEAKECKYKTGKIYFYENLLKNQPTQFSNDFLYDTQLGRFLDESFQRSKKKEKKQKAEEEEIEIEIEIIEDKKDETADESTSEDISS